MFLRIWNLLVVNYNKDSFIGLGLPIILLFYITGYDFVCLNDNNLFLTVCSFLLITFYYGYREFLFLFNQDNKNIFIKEYYYKFFLIKTFYLTYINYLQYNFSLYSNYYKYYNFFYFYLNNIFIHFNWKNYSSYLKFFFNYLNIFFNSSSFNFIELKFSTLLNLYYLVNISKFLKKKIIKQ